MWLFSDLTLAILDVLNVNVDIPEYMNYGSLGQLLGHEILHGYDSVNTLFFEFKKSNQPWNLNTEKELLERSKCIENQYNNYTVSELDVKVSAQLHKFSMDSIQ